MNNINSLLSLSPLDGRYLPETETLREYFSESALIKHRVLVEVLYLIELTAFLGQVNLTAKEKNTLLNWVYNLQVKDLKKVKKIEQKINHDVKAVEYFIKKNLKKLKLEKLSSWVHWGLTSEDVNNLALGLMLKNAKDEIIIPINLQLIKLLLKMAKDYASLAMPARTHGQLAVPTTLGKELIVFASRAAFFLAKIMDIKLAGKLNGAVGNFNSQAQIYPQKDWIKFSHNFVSRLDLSPTLITTQIEPSFRLVYFLDNLRQLNNVWLNLSQDCWFYIGLDYLAQKVADKEVGSSTMPHKVNPINFENCEGNLQLANALLGFFSNKLSCSRLQRDLSDSTVKRSLGTALAHSLLAVKNLIRGLNKIEPNKKLLAKVINNHPEMLSEGLQLILKTWGEEKAYEKIKSKTRGKKVNWQDLIGGLKKEQKDKLKDWRPDTYIGLATKLTKQEIKRIKGKLQTLKKRPTNFQAILSEILDG